jgi:hypothetical protein
MTGFNTPQSVDNLRGEGLCAFYSQQKTLGMDTDNASGSAKDSSPGQIYWSHEDMCLALRRNDPTVTELHVCTDDLLSFQLGDALQGNTHVSSLKLELHNAFGIDDVSSLLKFVRQSQSLRKVRIVDNSEDIPAAPAFLEALLQNPWITALEMEVIDYISVEIGPLIRSKPNLFEGFENLCGRGRPFRERGPFDEPDDRDAPLGLFSQQCIARSGSNHSQYKQSSLHYLPGLVLLPVLRF